MTINTDFAQTEVDQRQTNLTRYSLFFPEQRDFFLDRATFLDFASNNLRNNDDRGGSTDDQVIPFFSRRIGLSANATPQRIDYGTKATGQIGAQDVGLLHVRTGEEEDEGFASEDFTVARIKRRLMAQSYIGALYTRRDPTGAGAEARHTAGLDLPGLYAQLAGRPAAGSVGYARQAGRVEDPLYLPVLGCRP